MLLLELTVLAYCFLNCVEEVGKRITESGYLWRTPVTFYPGYLQLEAEKEPAEPPCAGGVSFRAPHHMLSGIAKSVLTASTFKGCVELCRTSLEHVDFYCLSGMYLYEVSLSLPRSSTYPTQRSLGAPGQLHSELDQPTPKTRTIPGSP